MAKTPKWQLVASVSVTVAGTPARRKNQPPSRYSVTRTIIHRISLGPASALKCTCRPDAAITYDADSLDVDRDSLCAHMDALYKARSPHYRIHLTPLGREMFVWRYVAEALK